jgi:chromosomal replication initiation ATPase DnaA
MGQVTILGDIGLTLEIVAELTNVPIEDLRGKGRTQLVASARALAYWAAREHWTFRQPSWPEVARAFDRDHTTRLMQARRVTYAVLNGDVTLARLCREITRRFIASQQAYASLSRYRIGESATRDDRAAIAS